MVYLYITQLHLGVINKGVYNMKFVNGSVYRCVASSSVAYTKGDKYTVYLNDDEKKCMVGNDGLEDKCSNLISSFELVNGNSALK